MKRFLILILLFISAATFARSLNNTPIKNCMCKGKKLYGLVKIVNFNADFKVKIVEGNEDLTVRVRDGLATSCGEWAFVENNPDFTVQFVEFNEDFTIRMTDF